PEMCGEHIRDTFLLHLHGERVGVRRGCSGYDRTLGEIAECRDLALGACTDRVLAPADNDLRVEAQLPQGLDRVLGGLGLHVPHRVLRDQGHMDQDIIVGRKFSPHLADRLEERHALDVANGTSYFDQADVRSCPVRELLFCRLPDTGLDLVGDMGDDLDGLAQEVAAALLVDDRAVYLAGGDVVGGGELDVEETLVVAEIKVYFAPVL